jgi:hypothetical protein
MGISPIRTSIMCENCDYVGAISLVMTPILTLLCFLTAITVKQCTDVSARSNMSVKIINMPGIRPAIVYFDYIVKFTM